MHTARSELVSVTDNAWAAPGVRLLELLVPGPWPFVPGQVAELAAGPGSEGYFAIASAPWESIGIDATRLEFLVKAGDSDSEPIMRVERGATLALRGPFGAGFDLSAADAGHDLLFVSAGTALAAARSAIAELIPRAPSARITLLIGVRRASDLCFVDELVGWRARGVDVRLALSDAERADLPLPAAPGRVHAQLASLLTPSTRAFIAGSEAFEDEVTRMLVAGGLDLRSVQRNYRSDARG